MLSELPTLTLYLKSGCSLCDAMVDELDQMNIKKRFTLKIIDISKDPALLQHYGRDIPVLFYKDKMLSRYFFDADTVIQVLSGATV